MQATKGELLVSILNNNRDFQILCEKMWYRIPVDSAEKWLRHRWPPKEKAKQDNFRDNLLNTEGWRVLRFNTYQVKEDMSDYCIPIIAENINRLGGLSQNNQLGKIVKLKTTSRQPDLFD
jgi:hypothetical protein